MARTATSSDEPLRDFCREVLKQEALLRQGGGKAGLERQRKLGRLPARERIDQLLDKDAKFFEIGRIFRNNSVRSAAGIPQFAAIMGNCVAGGAYLPVLCDKILMTEGSGLYLAGPSLVKAAIGQVVDQEELGGAKMHSEISGTVDFYEKTDKACLEKLRSLVGLLPEAQAAKLEIEGKALKPAKDPDAVYNLVSLDGQKNYDARDLLASIIDPN